MSWSGSQNQSNTLKLEFNESGWMPTSEKNQGKRSPTEYLLCKIQKLKYLHHLRLICSTKQPDLFEQSIKNEELIGISKLFWGHLLARTVNT